MGEETYTLTPEELAEWEAKQRMEAREQFWTKYAKECTYYMPRADMPIPTMPVSVKVGATRFKIVRDNGELYKAGKEMGGPALAGLTDHSGALIAIVDGDEYSDDFLRKVLTHEIVHCIMGNYSLNVENSEVEEAICDVMANGLIPLLRDNPELVEWLRA